MAREVYFRKNLNVGEKKRGRPLTKAERKRASSHKITKLLTNP